MVSRTLALAAILLGGDNQTEKYSEITIQTQSPTEVQEAVKGKAEVLSVKEFEVPKYPAPAVDITGDEDVIPFGELVILGVKEDDVSDKVIQKEYKWRVLENGKDKPRVKIENNSVTFGAGAPVDWKNPQPKSITVLLSVTYLYKDGEVIVIKASDILKSDLSIGGSPAPTPPTPPVPPVPKPDPTFPNTRFNEAANIYNNLKNNNLDSNAMKQISSKYEEVSKGIANGEFTTRPDKSPFSSPEEQIKFILAATAGKVSSVLTAANLDVNTYRKNFSKVVEDKLFYLIESQKINNTKDLADFFVEVSLATKEL